MALPARSGLQPRQSLGKYEILCRLAEGGMAELYLARAAGIEGFEKTFVIKRIRPELSDRAELRDMFLDEARLSATLHHPNIAQVYDVGVHDESYFLVMEYVHGEDVGCILQRAVERSVEIPLAEALSIVLGVCIGLHYAHERVDRGKPLHIVHRDVSPSNVLVSYDGMVKVVDFGIAKATNRTTQTLHSGLRGKLSYMSPEHLERRPLDRRADVFNIAILLYELTTRSRLYDGSSELEVMRRIVDQPAPLPSSRMPGYPPELERIVLRGLERSRELRYPTAQAMQLELEEFARSERVAVSSVRLAQLMQRLFGDEIDAWAKAQRGGMTLPDHLRDTTSRRRAPSVRWTGVLAGTDPLGAESREAILAPRPRPALPDASAEELTVGSMPRRRSRAGAWAAGLGLAIAGGVTALPLRPSTAPEGTQVNPAPEPARAAAAEPVPVAPVQVERAAVPPPAAAEADRAVDPPAPASNSRGAPATARVGKVTAKVPRATHKKVERSSTRRPKGAGDQVFDPWDK